MNFSFDVTDGFERPAYRGGPPRPTTKKRKKRQAAKERASKKPRSKKKSAIVDKQAHRVEIRQAVALAIRELRKRVGVSQEALALYSDVDRSYLGQIERGERSPTIEILVKLLPTLRIEFAQLAAEFDKHLDRVRGAQ